MQPGKHCDSLIPVGSSGVGNPNSRKRAGNLRHSNYVVALYPSLSRVLDSESEMRLTLEFGGGLELLCESVKTHNVDVALESGREKLTMRSLLLWVKTNLIKERPEMFIKGETVRPGILVLINDCDWELCGTLDTVLEEKDSIAFISTLHGG